MRVHRGFTLIELMIVVAIVALLAAIAVPAYSDYTIRAKLTEGYSMAMRVRTAVGAAWNSGGMLGLQRIATQYPPGNSDTGSKFVQYITANNAGLITVVFAANAGNGLPTGLNGQTITLTPQLRTSGGYVAPAAGLTGPLDWACASSTHLVATNRGMVATPGTLPSKYMPADCR
jgi:type IV pilus assembly protein PilA